jgi:hypothetical protein
MKPEALQAIVFELTELVSSLSQKVTVLEAQVLKGESEESPTLNERASSLLLKVQSLQ